MILNKTKLRISYIKIKVRKITTMATATATATTTIGLVVVLPLAVCTLFTLCYCYFGSNPSKSFYLANPALINFIKFINEQLPYFAELDLCIRRPGVRSYTIFCSLQCYLKSGITALDFLCNSKNIIIRMYPEAEFLYNDLIKQYEIFNFLSGEWIKYFKEQSNVTAGPETLLYAREWRVIGAELRGQIITVQN